MKKQSISVYCKNIRLREKLTTDLFAKKHNCSRQYISKIENGSLDQKHSIAQLNKLYRVYNLTFDDLHAMNIEDIFIEGVGLLHLKDPYADSKNEEINFQNLQKYLENKGYKNIQHGNASFYDMVGTNPNNNRFVCEMIFPFSTGVSLEKRNDLVSKRMESFARNVFKKEVFSNENPIEMIVFTSSEKNYNSLLEYKKKHFKNASANFISLRVIYIFGKQPPKEFSMF